MSHVINVHDLKTHYSKYLDRAIRGEEVLLGKHGKPVAKIVPLDTNTTQARKPGALAGKGFWIADDFDETPAEILAAMDQSVDEDIA